MRINLKSKKVVALGAAAAVVVSGGAAYAYWTAGGAGTGSGTTDAGSVALTVNQSTVLTAMYPGDTPQLLAGTFGNSNPESVYVASVTVSIASVFKDGAVAVGCSAADYTFVGDVMTVDAQVANGDPVGEWTGATIQFNNTGANQDACKGAVVNLAYAVV